MRIQELLLAQRGLEARLSRLEALLGAAGPARQPRTPVKAVTPNPTAGPSGLDVGLADLGQALLLMAGAFMLRAFTDSGLLPLLGGVALGLVYAVLWIGLAGRAAGRGKPVRALTYGITAALIAYPILSVSDAQRRYGRTNQANRNAIGSLLDLGILEPYSDARYDRLYWNRRVFQIIDS